MTYQCTENEGVRHSLNIVGSFGVGESLIGDVLLQAVKVLDIASTSCGSGVSEKGKDGILNVLDVV